MGKSLMGPDDTVFFLGDFIFKGGMDICMAHRAEDADPNVPWNFCGHVHQHYKVKRLNENSLIIDRSVAKRTKTPLSYVYKPHYS
ncbi:MAG: hypothetical protein ACOY3D_08455 [Candidatus Omnitrophota bacterium]